jgi:glycosyltransferase involved in cell wall biosynthesis
MAVSPRSSVTVLVPCLDEELAIGNVVDDLRRELPDARIVVIDNGSTDATAARARAAGAEVIFEPRRGKGHAVLAGFGAIHEDLVLMVMRREPP